MYSPRNQAKYYSPWGDIYYPPTSTGVIVTEEQYPFYVSEDLIKAFDNDNDLRKSLYITEGTFGYYYKKYTGEEVIITKLVACRTISCSEHPRLI